MRCHKKFSFQEQKLSYSYKTKSISEILKGQDIFFERSFLISQMIFAVVLSNRTL